MLMRSDIYSLSFSINSCRCMCAEAIFVGWLVDDRFHFGGFARGKYKNILEYINIHHRNENKSKLYENKMRLIKSYVEK